MSNYVIAIARGFGSGGKQIGLKLAEELGIQLIDKELLQMASIQSGINEELFKLADERIKKTFLGMIPDRKYIGNVLTPEHDKFVSDVNLFNYQCEVLKYLAETESFVVLGKAAYHVLRDYPNVVSVCIQAPFEDCVKSIMNRIDVDEKEAKRMVRETDKYRAEYNKFYTGGDWMDITNFDICLNSARIGRENCPEVIKQCLRTKLGLEL